MRWTARDFSRSVSGRALAGAALSLALAAATRAGDGPADREPPKAAELKKEPGEATAEPASALWGHLRLDLRYVARFRRGPGRDDRDQDAIQDIFVEGGHGDTLRFEVSGRLKEDVDGRPRISWFRDLYDTYGSWAHGHLYTAYAEALGLGGVLARIRAGRQYYAEGVNVHFDGGLVETAAIGDLVTLAGYGGVPVHLYESSPRGDWLAGGAIELKRSIVRVRFDGVHVVDRREDLVRDARRDGVTVDERRHDTLFLGTVVLIPTEWLRVRGSASTFDGRSTRAEGEVLLEDVDRGASLRARYVAQVGSYHDLSIEFTPLDRQLGRYRPYQEALLDARLVVADHVGLGGGAALRQLFRRSDQGPFNHEFLRVFGSVDVEDAPWKGLYASLLGEWYRTRDFGHTFQASGEVSQKVGDWKLGGGSRFSAWRADELFLVEKKYVRSFFGTGEWRPSQHFRLRLTYEYEVSHEDRFHVFRGDARIEF